MTDRAGLYLNSTRINKNDNIYTDKANSVTNNLVQSIVREITAVFDIF